MPIGQKCQVCEKVFLEDDDVVVCPACGAPHHRCCYEQQGACVFAERHSEGKAWQAYAGEEDEEPGDDVLVCPVCGQENETTLFFCKRCGENLLPSAPATRPDIPPFAATFTFPGQGDSLLQAALDPCAGMDPKERIGGHSVEELAAYVGRGSGYYLPRFREIEEGGRSVFNYAGAFLSAFWCFFRGMVLPGAVFFVVMIASSFVRGYFSALYIAGSASYVEDLFLSALQIFLLGGIMFLMGFLANRLYYKRCVRQITKIKETNPDDLLVMLREKGGVKARSAYVSFACFVALNAAVALLIQILVF